MLIDIKDINDPALDVYVRLTGAQLRQGIEAERGIVELDTLKQTNQNLIDTLEEVRRIQAEGSQKRREAEVELGRIEAELKNKLLEMKG